ncbi:MAG: hypothetical protein PVH93_08350 [Nitrosopumilaceae archaeon]|jgi:hypothetical protein
MVIFIIIVFVGGIGITLGLQLVFEELNIPYNENIVENRIRRFTEPLGWIEDRFPNTP